MNARMTTYTVGLCVGFVLLLDARMSVASDQEQIYESLADVKIGKVFFTPEKRQDIDRRRANPTTAGSRESPAKPVRKADAAGYIISSNGQVRVYSNGDFIPAKSADPVEIPGRVEVLRSGVTDASEANDASD